MISQWPPRVVAFFLWLLAALSASYWLMKVIGLSETPIRAGAIAPQAPAVNTADLLRVLGPAAQAGPSAVASATPALDPGNKMLLLGVVTGRNDAGIALISLQGQPPRPFRVGSRINETFRLARVTTRTAILAPVADAAASITLELAPMASTISAAPVLNPFPAGLPVGQSPFPALTPSPIPPPVFPRPLAPAPAGPLPPAVPVDGSKD